MRNAQRDRTREREYLKRPFMTWDGEGVTGPDGKHRYTLLANGRGDYWSADFYTGHVSTERCFRALLDTATKYPNHIHVIYGGSYDVNMFLSDLERHEVSRVYRQYSAPVRGGRYVIRYRAGKSFWLKDTVTGQSVTLYDVVSFFQSSFVKACDSYLGVDAWPDAAMVKEQKLNRSQFTAEDFDDVLRYCRAELHALELLCVELRRRLHDVGLTLSRWDGPGACASALMRREGIKAAMDRNVPHEVARAARFAYAGGRFELIKFGCDAGPAWEYDICSAYPAALRTVPNLNRGEWQHVQGDTPLPFQPFTLQHVVWRNWFHDGPAPFFRREREGTISYPYNGEGWYWKPEVDAAKDHMNHYPGATLEVVESWTFVPDNVKDLPFAFITPMYLERLALKKAGNGANVGIKLALNSLYGKLAQQVGWMPETPTQPQKLPPYHQLEWAGFVTSCTRAKVYRAAMLNPHAIIAFETDALFSSEPLPLVLGDQLGEWELTEFTNLSYFQSGFYAGTKVDGSSVIKTRGIEASSVDPDELRRCFRDMQPLPGVTRRFVTMGVALQGRWAEWQQWQVNERNMTLFPAGKRDHPGCQSCDSDTSLTMGCWHTTMVPSGFYDHMSAEFPVEWINPNPDMMRLTGLREEGVEQWDDLT